MVDANPFDPPQHDPGSIDSHPVEQPRNGHDIIFWGFVAAAAFSLSVYIATNFYARWHDPWLTPRYSPSMMIWRQFGGVAGRVMFVATPFGFALTFLASTPRKRLIAGCLTLMFVIVPLVLGLPV